MKRSIRIFLILSIAFISGFQNDDIYYIPLADNFSQLKEIKCSQFIDQFEYIKLETNEKCLIPDSYKAIILRNHIVIYSIRFCYVFDRKTGRFLCEIGKYGRGPEEYQNALLAYDYKNSVVFSGGWKQNILVFGLDGKLIRSFPMPAQVGGLDAPSIISLYSCLENSNIAGYYPNLVGIENKLLSVINQKGEITRIFPNRNLYPKRPLKIMDMTEAMFYYANRNTYFKERSTDTVFKVTDNALIPHLIFEMGKFSAPYEYKWMLPDERQKSNCILVNKIFENSYWIHLKAEKESVEYFLLFNKKTQRLLINKNGEGIPNDIDNFMPFNPEYSDEDGHLVQFVNALKINSWFKDNGSKVSEKANTLRKIDINQNPVMIIGRTKTI